MEILIYINSFRAPLAVLDIQRRFQRGSSGGKRNVLREQQDVTEMPDISLAHSRGGMPFQVEGPVTAKASLENNRESPRTTSEKGLRGILEMLQDSWKR